MTRFAFRKIILGDTEQKEEKEMIDGWESKVRARRKTRGLFK